MVDLFVRALIIATIIVAVTDAIVFYRVWRGKSKITPLFVVLVIIVTMVAMARLKKPILYFIKYTLFPLAGLTMCEERAYPPASGVRLPKLRTYTFLSNKVWCNA